MFTWRATAVGTVEQWRILLDDHARAQRDGTASPSC
jgi:hypothetical protein